ncbi:UNVERIFIED_CONTAM: Endo-1,4-beta-xylanase 1 [Sesamum latifolium]|uniref:Endo-1,4-beta-xylanase 1 n=1 Tax=Sesamum latifolium TaxID=2727402 RepID=A0AAW2X6T0_9LAMI
MERWVKVAGTFYLATMPRRVTFYLERPLPELDLLIRSVVVSCSSSDQSDQLNEEVKDSISISAANIILNHDFCWGLHLWQRNSNHCNAFVVPLGLSSNARGRFAVITNRTEFWQGLEQDLTGRVSAGSTYKVCAWVGISGAVGAVADVKATLKILYKTSPLTYLVIGTLLILLQAAISDSISPLQNFCFNGALGEGRRYIFSVYYALPSYFYLEGPASGIDLLIRSVLLSCPSSDQSDSQSTGSLCDDNENIIQNPRFDAGLNSWTGRGCKIVLHDSMADGKVLPMSGKFFASTENRTQNWNGIQQEITGRVQRKLAYEIVAAVRIFGNNVSSSDVRATLWVQAADQREQYIGIGSVQATDKDWVQLQGKFLLNGSPSKVVIYLEGPPPGTDILLDNFVVKHAAKAPPASPPAIENAAFGVNIISNSNLSDGTNGWFPLGNCTLSVSNGSPHILPPMAADSLGPHEPLSGRYILVTNRTQTWMGPAQMITDKIKLYLTYQVSAWIRIGTGATKPQGVNVALGVDGQWVNGGQVEINDDKWHEIGGSFRIEKQPAKVMVYVQGPDAGVDLMVAGLQIFPVDRHTRFRHLKVQTEKIRKRNVILKFAASEPGSLVGTFVKIRQTQNSFPFGSCVMRTNIDNEDFVDFFSKNFNWAVFGNELKWYWTEPQQGNFNYKDADELLNLCTSHNIQLRGHCIFWEVEGAVQSWVRALSKNDLMSAVQNRLTAGPSATLFVNDYHIEDGCDSRSSPEKYIQHILDLQEQGAPVGGIGIQGHIDSPVGPIVCSALDKLGILGLPIWFTELDVSSNNEYVRADDLEVMLREAFAHPAVDGVMLWGFWELFMSRDNAHLVNAEGDLNEAGKRYLALKQEWLSRAHGHIDEQGQFEFRGFHGSYEVEVVGVSTKKVDKTFVVDEGVDPLVITINL